MTVFQTRRLVMRQWTEQPDDLARVFDTYARWEVARWLGANPQAMTDPDQARQAVRRWRTLYEESGGRYGCWAVVRKAEGGSGGAALSGDAGLASGTPAGSVLFKPLPNGDGEIEVGWHLHPDSWGHGYATESARGAIDRGFGYGLSTVYAVVRPDNAASLAVCRRLGMTPLGVTERWYGIPVEAFRLDRPGAPAHARPDAG